MTAILTMSHRLRPILTAACLAVAGALVTAAPASARGPEGIADVAEKVIDAVVNI
jgi:serine protease Do